VGCSCGQLERTRLGPQARRKTIRQFSHLYVVGGKNRTCIGPHLGAIRRAEIPVISDVKVGYVRRSEVGSRPGAALAVPSGLSRWRFFALACYGATLNAGHTI